MKAIFQSEDLVVRNRRIPDLSIEPGACGGWQIHDADFAIEVLDGITGLQPAQS